MLDFLRSASTPPTDLLGIIRYVRARWRARLAVKGAVRARIDPLRAPRPGGLDRRLGVLLPRQAAAAPRQRRSGRAVPGRKRAVAADDAHQRGGIEPRGAA